MSRSLRVLLIVGAILVFFGIASRIRHKKILMQDAIYWVVLSFLLVLAALFPGVIIALADWLGFMSPSNFVFLVIVALLLIKIFSTSAQVSMLRHKVEELTQEGALHNKEEDDRYRDGE